MITGVKKIKKQRGDIAFDIVSAIIGILLIIVVAYPLYFIVIASFSSPSAVNNGEAWLLPKAITFEGYKRIFEEQRIWLGYRNTIFYTVLGTGFSLLFTLPAAYALSRKDLAGRKAIMLYFIFTMFFSGGLIPTYLTINAFKMTNTIWVLVLPFSVSVYNLIIARTFFTSSIPNELLESAQLDGCSNTRFLLSIALPLSKAIIAVIGLYYAVGQWNQYFTSLIYVRDPDLMPLQLVLRNILLLNQHDVAGAGSQLAHELQRVADIMKYGIIIVSTAPILCVYPFIQKYFTQGVMIGSVKG